MNRPGVVLIAAVSLGLLSACGEGSMSSDGSADDGAATQEGSEGGDGDLQQIAVGVIPIVDTAPLWLGVEEGFFEEEGLGVEITQTTGGAAAVPGVVSGSFDIAFGNSISVMVAADQGLSLTFVTNGATTTGESPDFGAVVAPEGSSISSPADLEGATVSVNNLQNIGDTTIRTVVAEDGGDPSSIDFVEIAFPDVPAALSRGQVDAAWVLEPFLSAAIADGATVVSYNYVEFDPELDIAGYFTTQETVEEDPDMINAFTEAMGRSLEYAQDNPEAVRDIVGTYTQIDDAGRAEMTLPRFRAEFDSDSFARLGESAVEYGTLDEAPDIDALLPGQ